jgi:hypothetical protein
MGKSSSESSDQILGPARKEPSLLYQRLAPILALAPVHFPPLVFNPCAVCAFAGFLTFRSPSSL